MSSKITIIGAGSVGSTIAYTLAHDEIASEIVLTSTKKRWKERLWTLSREPASEVPYP